MDKFGIPMQKYKLGSYKGKIYILALENYRKYLKGNNRV